MNRLPFQELRKVIAEKITIGGRHQEGQSNLFVHGDAEITRNLIARNNLTVLGRINAEGTAGKFGSVEVYEDTVIKGDLSVRGTTQLESVVLTSHVINTIVAREELSVGGSATLASCDNEINFLEFTKTRHLNDDEHTIVQNNDNLGEIRFKGSDGVNWIDSVKIYSNVDSIPGLNDVSSNINFATRSPGQANLQDRLTIISNGNIGISNTTPKVGLDLGTSDAIKIPRGSVAERPISTGSEHLGYIRYNTDLDRFEGFGYGNNWGSLGGVKDLDGDTYILSENSPGVDNDELNFYTDGISNMIIKSDGKIGVGVDLPAEKLDVNGNIILGDKENTDDNIGNELHFKRTYKHHGDQTKCGLVSFDNGYTNTANATIEGFVRPYSPKVPNEDVVLNYTPSIGFSTIHNTGPLTRRMIITEAGNVGIGTDDPESLLHLYYPSLGNNSTIILERDCSYLGGSNDGCCIEFKLKNTFNKTSYRQSRIRGINDLEPVGSRSGGLAFDTYSSDSIPYSERMRISGNGNVGIGRHQPGERLDVLGNIQLSGKVINGPVNGDKILLMGDVNSSKISHVGGYEYVNYHSGNLLQKKKNGNHSWYSSESGNWVNNMILTHVGNLGIGVNNPVESLEVAGSVKAVGLILGNISVTASAVNLNYTSGVTSNIQSQLDSKSPNTGHSALSTVGTLSVGSIGGAFGEITTNRTITGNSFVTGDISIGASKIGYGSNSSLATLSNTGIFIDGNMNTSGNIGIGTNNPSSKLHIYDNIQGNHSAIVLERDCTNFEGSDDGCGIEFKLKYTGNYTSYRQARIRGIDDGDGQWSRNGGIAFDTQYYPINSSNYLERMRIKGNGNVGIGSNNPSEKLTIEGGKLYIKNIGSNKSGIKLEASTPVSNGDGGGKICFEESSSGGETYGFSLGYNGGDPNSILNWPAKTFCISNHDNNVTGNISLAIARNTGNVGIGTTPGAGGINRLRVASTGYTDISAHQHNTQLALHNSVGNGYKSMGLGVMNNGKGTIQVKETGVGYSDLIIQHQGGNVGIGTTSPSQKLDVSGNIAVSGTVTQSDRRIKTDIEEVPDNLALSQVRDLECKYYHYKDPERRNETKTIGFISQEVATVVPNAVSKATKFIPDIMETPSSISWTELSEDKWNLKITLTKSISVGTKVKFVVDKTTEYRGIEVISEVISLENRSFVFELNKKYDSIFAYGTQIDDFHYIDKSQIFALHHSAIQQLDKNLELEKNKVIQLETKLQEKDDEINTCKHENDELKRRLEIIEKHLNLN